MSKETELVIFCKIGDFNGLKEASSVEEQEQLELPIPQKGRLRVRKTTDAEGTRFVACVKTIKKQDGAAQSCEEVEEPVSAAYMETFRKLADRLLIKTRYTFDGTHSVIVSENQEVVLPPIKYEVDVFKRHDGQISEWCKIDIELDEFLKAFSTVDQPNEGPLNMTVKVTHLPFKPQQAFMVGDCTEEQQQIMGKLWETEFTQNPLGGPLVAVTATIDTPPSPTPEVTSPEVGESERPDNESV